MRTKIFLVALWLGSVAGAATDRAANTVILDTVGVRNLRLETVEAEERVFETTQFAIGRLEEMPQKQAVVSSRVAGRVVALHAHEGDWVEVGALVATVESRLAGSPPPQIELRAPQAGTVVALLARLGSPVEPGEVVAEVSDRSELWAVAQVPDRVAARLVVGSLARIRIPASGSAAIEARLERFGSAAEAGSGTVPAVFRLANAEGRLLPGFRAEFTIVTERREGVLAVPREALQGDAVGRTVFIRDYDLENAFVKLPVVIGQVNDQWAEVVSGLFPGDEVVTQGAYELGFAGAGSISLKEALDAAHGHEHNEDGSEKSNGGVAGEQNHDHDHVHGSSLWLKVLIGYAAVATVGLLLFAQAALKRRGGSRS